jgi:hypothetical protein
VYYCVKVDIVDVVGHPEGIRRLTHPRYARLTKRLLFKALKHTSCFAATTSAYFPSFKPAQSDLVGPLHQKVAVFFGFGTSNTANS